MIFASLRVAFATESAFREVNVLSRETIGGAWEAHLRQRLFSWRLAYYDWRVEFNFVYQLVTDQAEYFNTPFSSQTE